MYVTRYQRICVVGQSLDGATTVDCAINRYSVVGTKQSKWYQKNMDNGGKDL